MDGTTITSLSSDSSVRYELCSSMSSDSSVSGTAAKKMLSKNVQSWSGPQLRLVNKNTVVHMTSWEPALLDLFGGKPFLLSSPYKRVGRKLKLGNFYGVGTLWPEQSDIVASISYGPRTKDHGPTDTAHSQVAELYMELHFVTVDRDIQVRILVECTEVPRLNISSIHQHMSVEDLRSVFQVDHHEKDYSNIIVDVRILARLNIDSHSPFTQRLLTNSTVRSAYKAIVSTNQGSGCFQTRVNETSSLTSRCHLGLPDNKVPTRVLLMKVKGLCRPVVTWQQRMSVQTKDAHSGELFLHYFVLAQSSAVTVVKCMGKNKVD
uniref:(California timema) hypothetical protein n=1 Tax=Timema californicum TaxID=61474 RepID=A0A7R9J452_TIMCA|nr:unnamed protein product [Timema californicum]